MATRDPATKPSGAERRTEPRAGPERPVMDLLYGTIRWAGGHARGLWAAVGLFLGIGLLIALASLGGFALLAEGVAGGATQRFDASIVSWARANTSPALDWLAIVGAALGSGTATWIVLGLGTVYFLWSKHPWSALVLWIALVGGRLLNTALKEMYGRPRPGPVEWDLEVFGSPISFPTSPSFPSGHALTSVIIFGTLTYLVMRLEPTIRQRRITLAVATVAILLIGLSRIYLGVHYPSDVLAGYIAGFVWATFAAFGIEAIRYFAGRAPAMAMKEEDLEKGMRPVREAVHSHPDG